MAGVLRVVAGQAALLDRPAEAALYDHARPEARAMSEEPAHAAHEGSKFSCAITIGEDHEQAREAVAERTQERLRAVTVPARWRLRHAPDIHRMDQRLQKLPFRIAQVRVIACCPDVSASIRHSAPALFHSLHSFAGQILCSESSRFVKKTAR
jgi:hypothetical protein